MAARTARPTFPCDLLRAAFRFPLRPWILFAILLASAERDMSVEVDKELRGGGTP